MSYGTMGVYRPTDVNRVDARAHLKRAEGGWWVKISVARLWWEDVEVTRGANGQLLKRPRQKQRERVETFGARTVVFEEKNDALDAALEVARRFDLPVVVAVRSKIIDAVERLIEEEGEDDG
jgi:hypothetical protein